MKKKLMYEVPDAELILIKLEGSILADSDQYGTQGSAGPDASYNKYDEDY